MRYKVAIQERERKIIHQTVMANRSKDPSKKSTGTIPVRVSPDLKARVEVAVTSGMSDVDGKAYESVSDLCRRLLERELARWNKTKPGN